MGGECGVCVYDDVLKSEFGFTKFFMVLTSSL